MTDDAKQEGTIDPFDLDALRVEGLDDVGVERIRLTVPVRRPRKHDFFRVHPDPGYCLDSLVYVREEGLDREVFLITRSLRTELVDVGQRVRIFTCITRRDTVFLWPARLPEADAGGGGGRAWHESALDIAEEARKHWVRMQGDRDAGAYVLHRARGDLAEPRWPEESFKELLKVAFKGRLIDTPHHDVIRELNGEL